MGRRFLYCVTKTEIRWRKVLVHSGHILKQAFAKFRTLFGQCRVDQFHFLPVAILDLGRFQVRTTPPALVCPDRSSRRNSKRPFPPKRFGHNQLPKLRLPISVLRFFAFNSGPSLNSNQIVTLVAAQLKKMNLFNSGMHGKVIKQRIKGRNEFHPLSQFAAKNGACSLGKAAQSVSLVFKNVENGQQLGNGQKVLDFFGQIQEFECPALFIHGSKARDQFADAA